MQLTHAIFNNKCNNIYSQGVSLVVKCVISSTVKITSKCW